LSNYALNLGEWETYKNERSERVREGVSVLLIDVFLGTIIKHKSIALSIAQHDDL
jgi:hypothetical protein